MTRHILSLAVAAGLGLASSPAVALSGAVDVVPANTLLLPHFEVDLDNPNNANTTFTITDADATASLAKVTLWTDMGVPTSTFMIYLTGFDVAEVNLRQVLLQGQGPDSATAGQDPRDSVSHKGSFSQDINFASCNGGGQVFPSQGQTQETLPPISWDAERRAHVQAAHTGKASAKWGGRCGGKSFGDNIARGYVTVELNVACNNQFPTDPGYAQSVANWSGNLLTGEFTIIKRSAGLVYTAPMAHMERAQDGSDRTLDRRLGTFYGHANGESGADGLEPLPSLWKARFVRAGATTYGPFNGGSSQLLVWRDPGGLVAPFTCGTTPAPFPLGAASVTSFNDEEDVLELPTTLFPLVSNLVALDAATGLTHNAGVLHMNLGHGKDARGAYVLSTWQSPGGGGVTLPAQGSLRSTPTILTSPNMLVVSEGGSGEVEVTLLKAPATGSVTFTVTSEDPTMFTVNPAMLTFTGEGSQTVNVNAPVDAAKSAPRHARLLFGPASSSDLAIKDTVPLAVSVVVQDQAQYSAVPSAMDVTEGGSITVTVTLGALPDMQLAHNGAPMRAYGGLQSSDPAVLNATSTFPQGYVQVPTGTITLQAPENSAVTGDQTITIQPFLLSRDPGFQGQTLAPFTITVHDND